MTTAARADEAAATTASAVTAAMRTAVMGGVTGVEDRAAVEGVVDCLDDLVDRDVAGAARVAGQAAAHTAARADRLQPEGDVDNTYEVVDRNVAGAGAIADAHTGARRGRGGGGRDGRRRRDRACRGGRAGHRWRLAAHLLFLVERTVAEVVTALQRVLHGADDLVDGDLTVAVRVAGQAAAIPVVGADGRQAEGDV